MNLPRKPKDHTLTKKPGEMDRYIGSRLRLWRRTMDVDAYALAARVGITYQQLQKYEKGMNRISATRLFNISQALNVPIDYFYQEAALHQSPSAGEQTDDKFAFLVNGSGSDLLKCYLSIKDPDVRKAVLNLLRSIVPESDEAEASGIPSAAMTGSVLSR